MTTRQEEKRRFWDSVSNRLTIDVDAMGSYIGCLCFFGTPGQWTYRVDYLESIDDSCDEERFLAGYEDYWYRWCCPVLKKDFEFINRNVLKTTDKRDEELEGL